MFDANAYRAALVTYQDGGFIDRPWTLANVLKWTRQHTGDRAIRTPDDGIAALDAWIARNP